MIYLYKVSGDNINIRHTDITHDSRIHVAVLDDSYYENVLLSLVLPEFTLTSNKLNKEDCSKYLNFIIDRYESILSNLKREKDYQKFFSRGDKFMIDQDLYTTEQYYKLLRKKANKIISSYEDEGINPMIKLLRSFKRNKIK